MEQVKDNSQLKRILKIVLTVLYYVFIVVLLTFSIVTIASRGEKQIPNLFGRGYLAIVSDSMSSDREDSIDEGDLIYVRILNDETRQELKVGDIVTFYDYSIRALNTHRIVEITENETGKYVTTQGDKAGAPKDPLRPIKDILAIHTKTKKGGGKFIMFLQSKTGFGVLIVLPVFILFAIQGFRFYVIIKENKKSEQAINLEEEREKIRAQLLEEMAEEEKKKDE
ncbi:MAG: signal peptidase I [Acholeplasmataceae bacterium]|jgi:signal peptidase